MKRKSVKSKCIRYLTWPAILLLGFVFMPQTAAALVVSQAEYFFDFDPGEGKGISVIPEDGIFDSSSETIKMNGISVSELTVGWHVLYVRGKDSDGRWGPSQKAVFHVTSTQTVSGAEYYIDSDPGEGRGQQLPAKDGSFDSVSEDAVIANIDVSSFFAGTHTVFVRGRRNDGAWGKITSALFQINDTTTTTSTTTTTTITTTTTTTTIPIQYTLNVSTCKGTGTITSQPDGINCGTECFKKYDKGVTITLTATPTEGFTFKGWYSSGCSGTGDCVITINDDAYVSADFQQLSSYKHKAIIVAGGGSDSRNFIWDSTKLCADYAYKTLKGQGYLPENILYLTPNTSNADQKATLDNFYDALNRCASDADDLLLYMIDHGGDGKFRIDSSDMIDADTFVKSLNTLQDKIPGRVICIIDACESGSFISRIQTGIPQGKQRIVITSSEMKRNAFYLKGGYLSFSFMFWAGVTGGATLNEAFTLGKEMMEPYQSALVDANNDGIADDIDVKYLSNIRIGECNGRGYSGPQIKTISVDPQILNGQSTSTLRADGVTGLRNISKVWAIIMPPNFQPGASDVPITDDYLTTIELTKSDTETDVYQGVFNNFTEAGTYRISIYAVDDGGFYSLPLKTTITQAVLKGDINGDQKVDLADALIALKAIIGIDVSGDSEKIRPDYIDSGADVNGNNKVGLEEIIHILQKVSGL